MDECTDGQFLRTSSTVLVGGLRARECRGARDRLVAAVRLLCLSWPARMLTLRASFVR
jgi:hypothetical protein